MFISISLEKLKIITRVDHKPSFISVTKDVPSNWYESLIEFTWSSNKRRTRQTNKHLETSGFDESNWSRIGKMCAPSWSYVNVRQIAAKGKRRWHIVGGSRWMWVSLSHMLRAATRFICTPVPTSGAPLTHFINGYFNDHIKL